MKKYITWTSVLAVSVMSLCGCKDDGVTPPPPAPTTVSSSGTVNVSEIGGAKLSVQSYFKKNSTVSNGQYATDVSTKGTQLLFVTDSTRQVRGLTLSTVTGGGPSIMECNAQSTAYALLFLTPGICTARPDSTARRITILNQLNSFSLFVAHLRSNLSSNSLNALITTQQTQTLLRDCINEFIAVDTSHLQSMNNTPDVLPDPNFFANRTTSTEVKLTNYNWRYVNVLRRDIRFDGVEKPPIQTISSDMGGGVPYSLGTVFAWIRAGFQPFPTISNDGTPIPPDVTKSDYWVIGPGKALGETPPQSVTQRMNLIQPYTSTILFYILFPVVDIVTGGNIFGSANMGQIMTQVHNAAEDMQQYQDVINAVTGVINAPDDVLATSESLATAVEVIFVGFVSNSIFYEGILTSAQATALLEVYGFLIGVTGAANVTIVAILYHITPGISKYTVESWIPVLMSPQNGYVTSSLTPTLSCYPVLGSTNYVFQVAQASTFANPVVNANSSSSQYQMQQGALSGNQQYYWRVSATVSGQVSSWSETRSFTTGSGSIPPNPVAYYPFNGNANDESGNGHHGTVHGTTVTTSCSFNGISNYLTIPATISLTHSLSISFWLKTIQSDPGPGLGARFLISRDLQDYQRDWCIGLGNGGKIQFTTGTQANDYTLLSATDINDNTWRHIVVVRNTANTSKTIYVDGQISSATTFDNQPFLNNSSSIFVGTNYSMVGFYNGLLDNIRMYSRALDNAEIQALYNEGH